jgi:hypothetical protein
MDVARSSERTDEQELCMSADETEGGSQGSRPDADAGAERRRAAPSGKVYQYTKLSYYLPLLAI